MDGLITGAISAGNHYHKADSPGFGATAKVDCSSVPNIPASRVSYYLFANPAALNNAYHDFQGKFAHFSEDAGQCIVNSDFVSFSPPCEASWNKGGNSPNLGQMAEYDYKGTPDITTTFDQELVIVDMTGRHGNALLRWWNTVPKTFISTGG